MSKFNGANWTTFTNANGLVNNTVKAIAIDAQGNIWFGTYGGVSKYDGANWTTYTKANGLASDTVFSIAIDAQGNNWFGTNGGVSKFDGTNWTTYTIKDGLVDNHVMAIAIDAQGNKWFGTSGGVSKFSDAGAGPLQLLKYYKGIVFQDLNGNKKRDANEPLLPNQIVKIDSNYTATQDSGMFYVCLNPGNHTFKFKPQENWQLTTDSIVSINIQSSNDTILFGVKPLANIHDVRVNVSGSAMRANFEVNYWIDYKNIGTIADSAVITLKLDTLTSFVSSIPTPKRIAKDTLSWNIGMLNVNQTGQIHVVAKMPNVQYLGDTLKNIACITIIPTDINLFNNTDTLRQRLTGSYDPNDKIVAQGVQDKKYVLFGTELTYTIHFQNTGTDTAFTVNVRDTLNSNLDVKTLQILGSSHSCSLELRGAQEATFHFNNINLPDSSKSKLGSQGYVKYSIKPKSGLAENSVVTNKGYIFFDFNPAIITNQTKNTYVSVIPVLNMPTSIINNNAGIQRIYPNPAQTQLTIEPGESNGNNLISIYNLQGQLVLQQQSNQSKVELNIESLPKGMYIVKITNNKTSMTGKFVKD